jgi:transcriptional regulator GlxA family with amidase domain
MPGPSRLPTDVTPLRESSQYRGLWADSTVCRRRRALRAFRGETGLPPHAYLNQLRVRRARVLLDDGVTPADVAVQVGFADQAHLTRHFKRVVGVPPAAYQRERLQHAGASP